MRLLRGSNRLFSRSCSFNCLSYWRFGLHRTNHTACEGLKILFCGSDSFSAASLERLYKESLNNSRLISSIDVLIKPPKWTGRGGKILKPVPIKGIAINLGLSVHELPEDGFKSWKLPWTSQNPINLIIAVSFGLKIPPKVLDCAQWGGLNLHPSCLPDLKGPAPLHHTLLQGRKHVGITLQTLDPYRFDCGEILDQTPYPGIILPNDGVMSVSQLTDFVAPLAADMLAAGLRNNLYDPNFRNHAKLIPPKTQIQAPKIVKSDTRIDWRKWTAQQIIRTERVLGRLWSTFNYKLKENGAIRTQRILFEGVTDVTNTVRGSDLLLPIAQPGTMIARPDGDNTFLDIWTCDQRIVNVRIVTMSGDVSREGVKGLPRTADGGYCLADGAKAHAYLS